MERENKECMEELGIGKLMRRIDAIATGGSGYSELWEEGHAVPDRVVRTRRVGPLASNGQHPVKERTGPNGTHRYSCDAKTSAPNSEDAGQTPAAHLPDTEEVRGSNLLEPTKRSTQTPGSLQMSPKSFPLQEP